MKKVISLLLVLLLGFICSACSNNDDSEKNTEILNEEATQASFVGEYRQVGFGLNLSYSLNENYTYDEMNTDEKGTYEIYDLKNISIHHNTNRNYTPGSNTLYKNVGKYYVEEMNKFEKDMEYGTVLSLDQNNRTNQAFQSPYYFTDDKNEYYVWWIKFDTNGKFKSDRSKVEYIHINGTEMLSPTKILEQFEGNYIIDDYVINLTCNDGTQKTLIIDNNIIYWDVLSVQ